MGATLNKAALSYGALNYYDEGLLQVYQDYKTYFLNHPGTQIIAVDPGILYRNENDPYGLILELGISPIYGWVVLMINDLHNGRPLPQGSLNLYSPSPSELETIRAAYESSKKIT